MEQTKIKIYLDVNLPKQYTAQELLNSEEPVKDVEELKALYETKYGSFGDVTFYVYGDEEQAQFIESINELFAEQKMDIKVDKMLLEANLDKFVPMIVVDDEIVSRAIYPDLTIMRGGSNSVNRGGCGAHGDH